MLGMVEPKDMYRKRDDNAKDINIINKNLADAREASRESYMLVRR